ncbi:hypothetical protein B0H21DRAFT_824297 [Amylocystis lapponica]|nr:hypothetical protein B0H21DRAFT_824297 [Amylocystis lapponica]
MAILTAIRHQIPENKRPAPPPPPALIPMDDSRPLQFFAWGNHEDDGPTHLHSAAMAVDSPVHVLSNAMGSVSLASPPSPDVEPDQSSYMSTSSSSEDDESDDYSSSASPSLFAPSPSHPQISILAHEGDDFEELVRIPAVFLVRLMDEAGLGDEDLLALRVEDLRRILAMARSRGILRPGAGPHEPDQLPGPRITPVEPFDPAEQPRGAGGGSGEGMYVAWDMARGGAPGGATGPEGGDHAEWDAGADRQRAQDPWAQSGRSVCSLHKDGGAWGAGASRVPGGPGGSPLPEGQPDAGGSQPRLRMGTAPLTPGARSPSHPMVAGELFTATGLEDLDTSSIFRSEDMGVAFDEWFNIDSGGLNMPR